MAKDPKQEKTAKSKGKSPKADSKSKKSKKDIKTIPAPDDYIPRMFTAYREKVAPSLKKHFDFHNVMQIPNVSKVTINVGIGDAHNDQKFLDSVLGELETIAGQKPVVTRAKKSVSNFKLREGMQVGACVTLRRARMWEFLDKLFSLAIPRVRDFRGLNDRSFDGRGNYSMGIKEQIVFPEIDYDKVVKIHGMDITIVTTARNDEEGRALLSELGCPFRKRESQPVEEAA